MLMSGAASAALPPVVNGNDQVATAQPSTSSLLGMYKRLEQLQRDVQQMRGQLEEQTYLIERLKKRQRDLYLDTDRRIVQLESGSKRVPVSGVNTSNNLSSNVAPQSPQGLAYPVPTSGAQDKLAYDKAFSSLKSGRYQQSITDLSGFVANFPNSIYLPNAYYWLGEASYVGRDFKRASEAFNQIVSQYPTHSKAKDALLKIGFIQYENKQWQQARETLTKVSSSYPGTTVASLAKKRLERLRQEKH